jgi:hypothetical protein
MRYVTCKVDKFGGFRQSGGVDTTYPRLLDHSGVSNGLTKDRTYKVVCIDTTVGNASHRTNNSKNHSLTADSIVGLYMIQIEDGDKLKWFWSDYFYTQEEMRNNVLLDLLHEE